MRTMSLIAVSQIVFLMAFSPTVFAQEWRFYGGDPGGTPSSQLKGGGNETDRHHIAPFESTPIVIGGVLYFSTPSNRVVALDAETGQEIWQFDPQAGRGGPRQFFQHRGVAYQETYPGDVSCNTTIKFCKV